MMHKSDVTLLFFVAGFSTIVNADFGLQNIKGLSEKIKAYQERTQQPTQAPNPGNTQEHTDNPLTNTMPETAKNENKNIETGSHRQERLDVVGVKIGMRLEDAIKTLKQHNQELKIVNKNEVRFSDADNTPHTYYIQLQGGNSKNIIESIQLIVSPPPGTRVVSINRNITYQNITLAPTMRNTVDALFKKYGHPIEDRSNKHAVMHLWRNGQGTYPRHLQCEGLTPHEWIRAINGESKLGRDTCGAILTAGVVRNPNNLEIAKSTSVLAVDWDVVNNELSSSRNYLSGIAQSRDKQELNKAQTQGKPKF